MEVKEWLESLDLQMEGLNLEGTSKVAVKCFYYQKKWIHSERLVKAMNSRVTCPSAVHITRTAKDCLKEHLPPAVSTSGLFLQQFMILQFFRRRPGNLPSLGVAHAAGWSELRVVSISLYLGNLFRVPSYGQFHTPMFVL